MIKLRFRPTVVAAAVAAAIAGSTLAQAQVLEEVIVTAQKREQSLQDVPIAVTAFTNEMLQKTGVRDMFELANNDPALIVSKTQTSTTSNFSIRGVFTSGQNFGLESSVGLYVDGVYRARQSSMINNLVDLGSVEVLRGPQGTLFGRNTPSGAVSMNSVKPDHEGTGYLEAQAGDLGLLALQGARSFSAIDNELAFRVTGFYQERDGYVDVIGLGEDLIDDRDRWGVRLQAMYTPSDLLSVLVIADRSEVDEICCAAGNYKNNLVAQGLAPGAPVKTGSDQRVLNLGGTVIDQDDFFRGAVAASFLPVSRNEDQGISVQVDWRAENFLVTSITAFRTFESYDNADVDFYDIDALIRSNDAEQEQFSQELRLSDETENFTWVVGAYYFEQDLDAVVDTMVGADTGGLVGVPAVAFPAGTGSRNVASQDHSTWALFGQFDYNLSDDLVLTAGGRWTKEDKDMVNVFTEDASAVLDFASPGWGFWLFPPLAPRADVNETIDDDQFTGTVKLSWFASDDLMLYASYGTGYKAGGVNTDRIAAILPVAFDAETSESFEVGMKAEFPEQALRVNMALHRTDTEDLQTISFQGTGFALQNAGVAKTQGGEIDIIWQPLDGLGLTLAYAYNDGEYEDFAAGDCWISTPWHTNLPDPRANGDGSCDRSGGLLSGNPENVVVASGRQEFPLGDGLTGYVFGEYIFTDERMTDVNNDPAKLADSYELLNLRAGLILEQWDAEITVWGRNVLDEDYTNTISDGVAQDGRLIAYFNEPATWGVTLRKNF
ncbi:TonB-dependent receptor [Haliea sp. E1-2-M8]|uniref:TonB-dependent receptor n=1 Tax=Haliea sp. E1-2-M8 TaxID=3064706 RepID=UPI002722B1B4|nr:TonB-dependent receptor [Haliea sp. E1-2-M8]MDO8863588.1 TonB-dependent receptor [Haliea sp. E1-2-M8]